MAKKDSSRFLVECETATVTDPGQESDSLSALSIFVDWSSVAAAPVHHVNQFLVQVGAPGQNGVPDGVYLSLGHLAPPLLVSSDPESQARELESLKAGIPVEVVVRVHMDETRLEELTRVLQDAMSNLQATKEEYQRVAEQGGGEL